MTTPLERVRRQLDFARTAQPDPELMNVILTDDLAKLVALAEAAIRHRDCDPKGVLCTCWEHSGCGDALRDLTRYDGGKK